MSFSFSKRATRSNYAIYLQEDVENTCSMPVNNYLSSIFGLDSSRSDLWNKVAGSTSVLQKLKEFRETSGGETASCAPFVNLANQILDELDKHTIRFYLNDNAMVSGTLSPRSSDVIVVCVDCLDKTWSGRSCNKNRRTNPFNILTFNKFEYNQPKSIYDAEEAPGSDDLSSGSRKRKSSGGATCPSNKRQKIQSSLISTASASHGSWAVPSTSNRSSLVLQNACPHISSKADHCTSYAPELFAYKDLQDFIFGMHTNNAMIRSISYGHSVSDRVIKLESICGIVCLFDGLASSNFGLSTLIASPLTLPRMLGNERTPLFNLFAGGPLSASEYSFTLRDIGRRTHTLNEVLVVRGAPSVGAATEVHEGPAQMSCPTHPRSSGISVIKSANSRVDFLNNLPENIVYEHLDVTETQNRFASVFPSYEKHQPRIIATTALYPIKDLEDPHQLMKVFQDVFFCYRSRYEKFDLLYRNLSEGNIMFRYTGSCIYGILSDFDLCRDQSIEGFSMSCQQTGTAPFMAIDFLENDPPPRHLYRHDLESLYYIIVCNVCDRWSLPIKRWFKADNYTHSTSKRSLFVHKPLQPREGYELFAQLLGQLHYAFRNGMFSQMDEERDAEQGYDDATLGGFVSFESISAIFDSSRVSENGGRGSAESRNQQMTEG
ncbi:hypothetical protein DL96DRAFT_1684914 [Flagelloscypha sp. PMI_526]|nr:hypothetical protein DL96DRAFT_1684914 [Flagelloscypha sp. PMI_526]